MGEWLVGREGWVQCSDCLEDEESQVAKGEYIFASVVAKE